MSKQHLSRPASFSCPAGRDDLHCSSTAPETAGPSCVRPVRAGSALPVELGQFDSYASAPRPGDCSPGLYGRLLTESRISPHAAGIRIPIQVRQHIYGNGTTA